MRLSTIVKQCKKHLKIKADVQVSTFRVSDSAALIHNVGLSIPQYQIISSLQHGINFPTRNIVNEKAKYHPVMKRQTIKYSVEMDSLLKSTFALLAELSISFLNQVMH